MVRGDAREGVDYTLEELTWLWQVTTAADKRIIQNNQKGVNSRFYQSGPYAPMEHTLMRYVAWYLNEISSSACSLEFVRRPGLNKEHIRASHFATSLGHLEK